MRVLHFNGLSVAGTVYLTAHATQRVISVLFGQLSKLSPQGEQAVKGSTRMVEERSVSR